MPRPVTFAIVGCGRIAGHHVRALDQIDGAKLVAVSDHRLDRARKTAPEGVKVYTNYHKMLRENDIDVVNVMTPSGMHAEHAIDIMTRYGKHLVVEKPMALRLQDADAMIATAESRGVQLHVVMQNRFNKAVQKIRSAIEDKLLGKPVLGTVRLRWCRPQRYYDQDAWRGTWAFDGGALTNQAVHHIDLLQWLMGDVEEVSAIGATQLVHVEVEDTAAGWVRFKNGALGAIEATTGARPDDVEASISILAGNGMAIAEGASVNRITRWTFTDEDMSEYSEVPPDVYGFGHISYLANVVRAVRGEIPPVIDGREGKRPVQLLHALYASIEANGRPIRFDEARPSARLGVRTGPRDEEIRRSYLSDPEER